MMTNHIIVGSGFVPSEIAVQRLKDAGFVVITVDIKNYRDDLMGHIENMRFIESNVKPAPVPLHHPVTKKGKKGKRKKDWD